MNNDGGAIGFEAYIQTAEFKRGIADLNRGLSGFTKNAVSETQRVNDTFNQLGKLAAGAFAFNELASLPKKLIEVRGEFQQLEIAFTTMLKSKSKADALMQEVIQFAGTTPFGLKDSAQAVKQLLAYGSASNEVIGELRTLGDVAAGVSAPIGDLTYLYGTLRTQGRAYAVDIRQFAGRGIPIYAELAKVLGVNVDKVNDLVEAGKVGFPQVEKAFKNMTSTGGLFAGLMEAQSKSLTGLTSQFSDAVEVMFNKIGKSQEGALSEIVKGGIAVVENYEPILDVLKVLIATYGTYKTAIVAAAAVQTLSANAGAISAFFNLAGSIKSAADAQALFNLVTGLNPYVAAASALVGLITAVALFRDTSTEAEKAQERLSHVNDRVTSSLAGELSKVQILTTQIQNENVSRDERNKKLQELISIHPQILSGLTLENIATENGTKAINDYIDARKRQIEVEQLKVEMDESIKRQLDAKNGKNDTSFLSDLGSSMATMGSGFTAGTKGTDYLKVQAAERKKLNAQIEQEEINFQKGLLEKIASLQTKAAKEEKPKVFKNIPYYEAEIQSLKDLQKLESGNNAQFVKYQKEIDALQKAKNKITGERTKAEKDAAKLADKEADQSGPYGSESYWNFIASKAKEVLSKTPVDQTAKIAEQNKIISDAEKNAENVRKAISVKTFDEQLEEKKKLYSQYQLWVDHLGENAANEQFDGLITKGKSYAEYLKGEINKLESVSPESLTGIEQNQLVTLKVQYSDATNAEKPLEAFQKRLDNIRNSATSLTDEIEKLKAVQAELGTTDMSGDAIMKRQITQQQLNQATQERGNQFRSFLVEVAGSEQKRLDIEARFQSQRKALEEKYGKEKGQIYDNALKAINEAEQEEYEQDKLILAEKSKEFKAFAKIMQKANEDLSGGDVKTARENFEKFTAGLSKNSDEYQKYLHDLEDLEDKHRKKSIETWSTIANGIGQIGQVMSEIGGPFGKLGSALTGLASGVATFNTAMSRTKEGKLGIEQYAAAAQGVANLVGIITSSAKERKLAEEQYYNSVIGQQQQYNLLLNEQIGLQGKASGSVFYTDFEKEITSGFAKAKDAQQKGLEVMAQLQNGKAKNGQKNGIDWQKVGAGAVSGATIGAVAGGGVFSWVTTAVGAVGGAIAGLIGGLKKKDTFTPLLQAWPGLIDSSKDGLESFNAELAQTLIDNNLVDEATKNTLKSVIEWKEQLIEARDQIKGVVSDLAGALGDDLRNGLVGAFEDGTSAADAFGNSVSKILDNILQQMIFSKVLGPALDQLQAEMNASMDGGDGSWVDDFGRFFSQAEVLGNSYFDALTGAQAQAANYGIDIFKSTKDQSQTNALSGAIQGTSQETTNVLVGQINAIRITQADTNSIMRQQLLHMSNISANSNYLPLLASIDKKLDSLKPPADGFNRAYGGQ